jgi:hypothetical protein
LAGSTGSFYRANAVSLVRVDTYAYAFNQLVAADLTRIRQLQVEAVDDPGDRGSLGDNKCERSNGRVYQGFREVSNYAMFSDVTLGGKGLRVGGEGRIRTAARY